MRDFPNYNTYHLDELERALANLDEAANPEEAKIIREYIEKGGYAYPSNQPIERVEFINPIYKWSLTLILTYLLTLNAYALIVGQAMLALLPVAIQAALLYMIFKNYKHIRTLIKVWCVVLLISAFAGFVSMHYATEIESSKFFDNMFSLIVGLSFLVFADRSILLVPNGSNN